MNAIKFIKNNGVDKAREVVEGAPSNAESYQDSYYFRTKPEFQFHNGFHPVWNLTDNDGEYFKKRGFDQVGLNDLKRLVESVDLVKRYGGIAEAKTIHNDEFWCERAFERLEQAIADYELIYGVK